MTRTPETDWGSFDWDAASQEQQDRRALAEEYGWATLNRLLAYSLSTTPRLLRPASMRHGGPMTWSPDWAYGPLNPYIGDDGQWRNAACSCDRSTLILPFAVSSIEYVQIDGRYLDQSAYRVDDGNMLVRQDGGVWPVHQSMARPAGEEGTFVISALTGSAPTDLERFAAGVLAREFLKLVTGDQSCRLPKNLTSYVRSGTTITVDNEGVKSGMVTGIPEVDNIVRIRNPHRLTQQSRVYSPDTIGIARTTTFASGGRAPAVGTKTLVEDPAHPGFWIEKTAVI